MKIYYFKRQSNDFSDILKDKNIKKFIDYKITWKNHALIGLISETPDDIKSYITIKYGDDMIDRYHYAKDRTPIPKVDYYPENRNKEKLTIQKVK